MKLAHRGGKEGESLSSSHGGGGSFGELAGWRSWKEDRQEREGGGFGSKYIGHIWYALLSLSLSLLVVLVGRRRRKRGRKDGFWLCSHTF